VLLSGLVTQSEITQLLGELYGSLGDLPPERREEASWEVHEEMPIEGYYLLEPELV
jgi:hypothetical protein